MSELMIDRDPRLREFAEAYADSQLGIYAPQDAHERYRQALFPYVEYWAEVTPDGLARRTMMAALFGAGLPLGLILGAFIATEEEAEYVRKSLPPLAPPVTVSEVERLRMMPYGLYLRTPHWRKVREGALERAGGRCMLCNTDQGIEVHHRFYGRRGCERPADVVVLCGQCHGRHHEHLKAAS